MRWTRVLVVGSWVSLATLAVAVVLRVGWHWSWLMSLPSRTVTAVLAVAACSSAAVDMGFLRPINVDGGVPAWSWKRPAVPAVLSVVAVLAFIAVPSSSAPSSAVPSSGAPSSAVPSSGARSSAPGNSEPGALASLPASPTTPTSASTTRAPTSAPTSAPAADAPVRPGKCVGELDFDRYANAAEPVAVGLHADVQGVDRWTSNDRLWLLVYQRGVGFFPTPDPPQRNDGGWRSETMQFGGDESGPDHVERDIFLVVVDAGAEQAIREHLSGRGGPMAALPTGATEVGAVPTKRSC